MTDATNGAQMTALYTLAIVVLLSAFLMSASIYFSVNGLSDAVSKVKLGVTGGSVAAAPSPSPSPSPNPSPSPAPSPSPSPAARANIDVSGRPVRGDANAKVTMIEFGDFECPFCERAYPTVNKVMSDYAGKVKLVYMHFPLSFHPSAQKAAEASECANDQGKFWEMHDKMYENRQLDIASLKKNAAALGLDTAKFNACLDGGSKAAIVSAEQQVGSGNGVGGTPTFFINGVALVGAQPYDAFKQAIDAELAK